MKRLIALTALLTAWSAPEARAAGLSTNLGQATIANVPVGSTISLRDVSGVFYKVTNTARSREEVLASVMNADPARDKMQEGYEPLPPDVKVSLSRNSFVLAPGQQGAADIQVFVPKDPKHLGKKYQFHIYAHGAPDGKRMFAVGLKSRILLNVSSVLMSPEEIQRSQQVIDDLNFHLNPFKIEAGELLMGRRVDVSEELGKSFRIINLSDKDFRVRLKHVSRDKTNLQTVSDVLDDVGIIHPELEEITVAANSIGVVRFSVEARKEPGNAGKKARFILEASLLDYAVPVSAYGQVWVTLK